MVCSGYGSKQALFRSSQDYLLYIYIPQVVWVAAIKIYGVSGSLSRGINLAQARDLVVFVVEGKPKVDPAGQLEKYWVEGQCYLLVVNFLKDCYQGMIKNVIFNVAIVWTDLVSSYNTNRLATLFLSNPNVLQNCMRKIEQNVLALQQCYSKMGLLLIQLICTDKIRVQR